MSASDAAPLPRLGEVYFDVRGESRSMRLSWYADTGVAVFSIWQGGTCTGTFRLPIADLPRMVEALQRGPHGRADQRGRAGQRDRADQRGGRPGEPGPEPDTGYSEPGFTAAYTEHPADYGAEPSRDPPDRPGRGHRGEPATTAYREDPDGEYRRTGAHSRYEEDEPTGVYRGDPLSHGHQVEPGVRYREPGYPDDDPLTGRYPVEDPHRARYSEEDRYPEEDPYPARYRDDPHPPRHQDDPPTGRYHGDPRPSRYPDDPLTGDYQDDTASRDYPASPANAGYSPARPYVAPVPGGTGPVVEGRRHGRRRAADREEDDPSPDSFPYGRPSVEPEPGGRER